MRALMAVFAGVQVTEYVPYDDPARLQQWTDHVAMANWQAQLDGSTRIREVEGWDEFEDNASGLKFYWQKVCVRWFLVFRGWPCLLRLRFCSVAVSVRLPWL